MDLKAYSDNTKDINSLIEKNMGLVRKIAWQMHGRVKSAIDIEDLIQIGMYGLVTAAQNYVVKEGVSFASYASIRIRGEIVDHLRRNSNLCRTTIQMQQKYKSSVETLSKKLLDCVGFLREKDALLVRLSFRSGDSGTRARRDEHELPLVVMSTMF